MAATAASGSYGSPGASVMAQLAAAAQQVAEQKSVQQAAAAGAAQQASAALLVASDEAAGAQQLAQQLAVAARGTQPGSSREGLVLEFSRGLAAGIPDVAAGGNIQSTGGSSAGGTSTSTTPSATASGPESPSKQLAQAAAASRQVAAQKHVEQQAAAAAYRAAASHAATAPDVATASKAVAAAHQAAAAFSAAASEAAAAQESSCQLQQAAAATAAAEASPAVAQLTQAVAATQQVAAQKQAKQTAAAMAYHVATSEAAAATDALSAGKAITAVQQAAQDFSMASSEAAAAQEASCQLQKQAAAVAMAAVASQQLPFSTAPMVAALAAVSQPPAPPNPNPAAVQLAGAAAAAQQVHAKKVAEQQAAAVQYNAATSQAAAATSLHEQVHAAMAVQQAAAAYTTAANEAAVAASAAEQLHNAAVAAAAVPVAFPSSAPLAASIAAGMLLPAMGPATGQCPGQVLLPAMPAAAAAYRPSAASLLPRSSAGSIASTQRQSRSTITSSLTAPAAAAFPQPASALLQAACLPAAAPAAATVPVAVPAAPVAVPAAAALGLVPAAAVAPGAAGTHAVHWGPSGSSKSGSSAPHYDAGGGPSQENSAFHSVSAWSQAAAGIARTCKMVCINGGSFVKMPSGTWDYEGGDTRLVAVPFHCGLHTLVEALERATAPLGGASNSAESASDVAPGTFAPQLKYRLPSDPSVWVDLVDDEDVALMFDEYDEHRNGGSAPGKLHLFVQWRSPQDVSLDDSESQCASGPQAGSDRQSHGEKEAAAEEAEEHDGGADSEARPAGTPPSSESRRQPAVCSTPARASNSLGRAFTGSGRDSVDLGALVDKMEIIDPANIQLLRFLGSGGYGDVYLGRWHGSEVAVKCLNPSLFFGGGEFSSINRSAIVDLIKEADLLGSMRHPNVVWVYGVVLPHLPEEGKVASCDGSGEMGSDGGEEEGKAGSGSAAATCATRPKSDVVDAIACGMRRSGITPGMVRPPAMVAEYMAGGSLKSALARKADIVAGQLTRVVLALDAAKGMEYLHSKSLVHFDLKSANLLLGYRDRRPVCKVADFGLSKQKLQTYVSGVSSQRGTLPWTAPEILQTPDAVTEKIDVFSFGIVMWELWTGLEPYAGLNYHALMLRLASPREHLRPPIPGSPDWEGEAPAKLVPGWRALMERCWADEPSARPPFSEIIQELRGMVSALKPRQDGTARGQPPQAGEASRLSI